MFYEYAIEPSAITNDERAQVLLEAFGPWKGRFLAKFPKKWPRLVIEQLKCRDKEKKTIIERLTQIDKRTFSPRSNAFFDPTVDWMTNAIREHSVLPFRALISLEQRSEDFILKAPPSEMHPRWRVRTGDLRPKDGEQLANDLRLLLLATAKSDSKRLAIIDRYFDPNQESKRVPLREICRVVSGLGLVLEVHTSDKELSYDEIKARAERKLPDNLPAGATAVIYVWDETSNPAVRFHWRAIVSEVAGVRFGDSIEQGENADHDDAVSIMDDLGDLSPELKAAHGGPSEREKAWDRYCGKAPAFKPAGTPIQVVGTGRLCR